MERELQIGILIISIGFGIILFFQIPPKAEKSNFLINQEKTQVERQTEKDKNSNPISEKEISSETTSPTKNLNQENLPEKTQVEKKVITPPPLEGPVLEIHSQLTSAGTITETNRHRQENGLALLVFNEKLSQAAQNKLDDMFNQQYFAHESPTGDGPGELADAVDYNYLMVGENLALGNYESDAILVQAWMDSPGHRANILNPDYKEIGVAVGQGNFNGLETWFAVQEFGRPASDCPIPNSALEQQIKDDKSISDELKSQIETLFNEINKTQPKRGSDYNEKIETYNILIEQYNLLIEKLKTAITEYNNQVILYNQCL